jgi:hypothetical protein
MFGRLTGDPCTLGFLAADVAVVDALVLALIAKVKQPRKADAFGYVLGDSSSALALTTSKTAA